jgi:hypothetical protein
MAVNIIMYIINGISPHQKSTTFDAAVNKELAPQWNAFCLALPCFVLFPSTIKERRQARHAMHDESIRMND